MKNHSFIPVMALAVVILMIFSTCLAPARATIFIPSLLVNSEFRDGGAGWELGEYGAIDGKVTREGYPSVKLSVAKVKQSVNAEVRQVLPAGSWAVGDTLTLSAYLARGKTSAFTKKTLPVLALYAVVGGESKLFPSEGIKKLKDIKEAGTKNKSSAWSRFSATMTVPEGASEVGCLLQLPQNGTVYMTQPKVERGDTATDWYPDPGHKEIAADGAVTVGTTGGEGFLLSLPAGAYAGEEGIAVTVEDAQDAPTMPHAQALGTAIVTETGGPVRLEETATLTYAYDPEKTPDPLMLCLGYYDGEEWSYIPADSVDTEAHTLLFPIHHFSSYYPSQFKSELDAAKHYAKQFAAHKVLGEGGGNAKVASRTIAEIVAAKLGLSGNKFAEKMIADVAADQDVVKVAEECQAEGWSDTGYEKVMTKLCGKISGHLVENRSGLTAEDGVVLTGEEKALKEVGTLIKTAGSGSKILAAILEGDDRAVAKELFGIATDNLGMVGTGLKYTLQAMQNSLGAWKDGEVEKAYQVYVNGSSGSLFGYGLIDPKDFDAVWNSMKGSSRQLCIERIAAENEARRLVGLPRLTAAEEDLYRERVKQELQSEFEKRFQKEADIERETENLNLIFEELNAYNMLDSTAMHRGFGGDTETLKGRMERIEHLIQRIYRDLDVKKVFPGAQLVYQTGAGISAMEMASMIYDYFSAPTQAEGEERLREHYQKFGVKLPEEETSSLYPSAGELSGTWSITVSSKSAAGSGEMTLKMNADGSGTTTLFGTQFAVAYVNNTFTMAGEKSLVNGDGTPFNITFQFTGTSEKKDGGIVLTGSLHLKGYLGKTENGTWTATKKG